MSNIMPVTELRNYNKVLKNCQPGSPVLLTKNGRDRYAILDVADYDKLKASIKLISNLEEGEKSAREEGWLSADDVEAFLGV